MEDAGDNALERLANTVRQPTSRALDNARALFPFLARETVVNDDEPAAPDCGLPGPAEHRPATPAGRA